MKTFEKYINEFTLSAKGKKALNDFMFKTEKEALKAGKELDIKGSHQDEKTGKWMPGKSHDLFVKHMLSSGMLESVLDEAYSMSPADKKVVNAFTKQLRAQSSKLMSDGNRLDGRWMGGNGIATWELGKIVLHDLGSKAAQTVQTFIKKNAAKNDIKEGLSPALPVSEAFELMTSDVGRMWQDMSPYAASRGYKIYMGGAGFMDAAKDISLYMPKGDEKYIKDVLQGKLKSGEYIFRYVNPMIKAGGMIPLVKISLKRGLIYYNKPEASDEDILDFDTRGRKLRYINMRDDYKSFLKPFMHGGTA